MHCCKKSHSEIVKFLVKSGADIESKDAENQTPLHIAAKNNKLEIAQFLVERGEDTESKDNENRTPLHAAAIAGHIKIVKFLVENGADKESKDNENRTPLHYSAYFGNLKTVQFLVESGADKEAKDNTGQTPLQLANGMSSSKVAKFLLDSGADRKAKDKWGQLIGMFGNDDVPKKTNEEEVPASWQQWHHPNQQSAQSPTAKFTTPTSIVAAHSSTAVSFGAHLPVSEHATSQAQAANVRWFGLGHHSEQDYRLIHHSIELQWQQKPLEKEQQRHHQLLEQQEQEGLQKLQIQKEQPHPQQR